MRSSRSRTSCAICAWARAVSSAALDAADEIGLAVVATSFTIIAVFLPVSFMSGITGQYFKQFGLTVAAAVFFSLLVARLITPVLAAYSLRSDTLLQHPVDGPIMTRYLQALRWVAANRWKTICAGVAFFIGSVALLATIPQAFVPAEDFASAELDIELPPGGTLDDTARVSAAATALLRKSPEVTDVIEFVGGDEVRTATLYITLVPRAQRGISQKQWEQKMAPLMQTVPDGQLNFSDNGGGRDMQLYLTGDDPQLLRSDRPQGGRRKWAALSVLRNSRIEDDLPRPEILVRPHLDLAAQLGVTVESISDTIRIATLGDLTQNSAKFSLSDRQMPIRVSLLESGAPRPDDAREPAGADLGGASVPLKAVADMSFGQGPSAVRRYNQSRRVIARGRFERRASSSARRSRRSTRCRRSTHLPPGVHLVETGDAQYMTELITNFVLAMGAGVLHGFCGTGAAVRTGAFSRSRFSRRCRYPWAAPCWRWSSRGTRSRCRS